MPKIMKNGVEYSGASTIPQSLQNKVGTDTLDTTAQDLSGAVNELDARMLTGGVGATLGIESLFLDTTVATSTTYNTYSGRQFSDYALLLFIGGASNTDSRNTVLIPSNTFATTNASVSMSYAHDSGLSKHSAIVVKRASDTSFTVTLDGVKSINHLRIIGILKYN